MDVQTHTFIRIGAVCGVLYSVLTIGTPIYIAYQPSPPTSPKVANDRYDQAILAWVRHHQNIIDLASSSSVIGFVLLGVVAAGLFVALRTSHQRILLIATAFGGVGLTLSAISAVLEHSDYVNYSQQYLNAHVPAAVHRVVKAFESNLSRDVNMGWFAHLIIALWIGLIGTVFYARGQVKNIACWGSLATCLFEGIGLPMAIVWSTGAGVGLWRVSKVAHQAPDTVLEYDAAPPVEYKPKPTRSRLPAIVAPQVEPLAIVSDEPVRPPRGTSVPRHQPAPAKGSKATQARRRR
jgi:hypothetical protein